MIGGGIDIFFYGSGFITEESVKQSAEGEMCFTPFTRILEGVH